MGVFILFSAIFGIPCIVIPFVKAIRRNIAYWKQQKQLGQLVAVESFDHILDAPIEQKQPNNSPKLMPRDFPEIWFLGISPIMGIFLVRGFYSEIKPFDIEHTPSLFSFILITYFSYWLSRYFKEQLPVFINIALSYGMLLGFFLYLALFFHYLAPITFMAGAIFAFLAFPLFAPLPAFLYNLRELREQQIHLQTQIQSRNSWATHLQLSWQNFLTNSIVFIAFLALTISLLNVLGQSPIAIILAFLQGSEFLFSSDFRLSF